MNRLILTFLVAVIGWLLVVEFGQSRTPHPHRDTMLAAAQKTELAFAVVDSVKQARGLTFPFDSPVPWRALLGEDYTAMTTTLGSREAKEVSTNPAWASLLVGLLADTGVTSGDQVVVLASGSFPALAVAALSAVDEMGIEPLLVSSLGASSYGANVRQATWLDLESWIREAGVLDARSLMVTRGGEDDAATGLSAEGRVWLEEAALRNGAELERFGSLEEAVTARVGLVLQEQPAAVVNIGGGQAVLGRCPHTATLPVGVWRKPSGCNCSERGALVRIADAGIPVIHLLNVRGLAARYGLDFQPGIWYNNTGNITTVMRPNGVWILAVLAAILLSLAAPKRIAS